MNAFALKNNYSSFYWGALVCIAAIPFFTPIIGVGIPCLAFGVILLGLSLSRLGNTYHQSNIRLVISLFVYILICCVYKFLGISTFSIGAMMTHLFFFVSILSMLSLPNVISDDHKKIVFFVIAAIIAINIIDNIRLCIKYPELLLMVNRSRDFELNVNIGGSRFYNAIVFFYTICLFGFLNVKEKLPKYLLLGSIVISAVFIFGFCLKASTLLSAVLSTILLIFSRRARNLRRLLIRLIIPTLIIYVIINIFLDSIVEFLSSVLRSERLLQRVIFVFDQDNEEAASGAGTVAARGELWMLSFNTWTDNIVNFFFGIGDHRVDWETVTPEDVGIGQHSTFFDSLARYGLFGMMVIVSILYRGFNYLISLFDRKYWVQLHVIILVFVLYFVTKGVFVSDIGFLMFVFLPLLSIILNKQVDNQNL